MGYIEGIGQESRDVFGQRRGVGAGAVPAEHIVVENLFEIDGIGAALVDVGLIVVGIFGERKGGGLAVDPQQTGL